MQGLRTALVLGLIAGALGAPARAQQPALWETPFENEDVTFWYAAAHGGLVFASGYEVLDAKNEIHGGFIAALDAKTGEVLWSEQGDPATGSTIGGLSESFLGPLATSKGVVVAGGGRMVAGPDMEGAVRAYDEKTGTLLWSKHFPTANFTRVAVAGKTAFAAITPGSETSDPSVQLVAYDLFTGDVLWDETYGPSPLDPRASDVVATGKVVAVAGLQTGAAGGADTAWLVRAHDAKTGEFLWEDVHDPAAFSDVATRAVIKGSRLFVGGWVTPVESERNTFVRAYQLKTGDAPWDHEADEIGLESAKDIVTSGSRVITLASNGTEDYVVRSQAAKTGIVGWDEPLDIDASSNTVEAVASGSRVVIPNMDTRALDAKTGQLAWDSPFHGFSAVILGPRVFVVGIDSVAAFPLK